MKSIPGRTLCNKNTMLVLIKLELTNHCSPICKAHLNSTAKQFRARNMSKYFCNLFYISPSLEHCIACTQAVSNHISCATFVNSCTGFLGIYWLLLLPVVLIGHRAVIKFALGCWIIVGYRVVVGHMRSSLMISPISIYVPNNKQSRVFMCCNTLPSLENAYSILQIAVMMTL